MNSNEQPIDFYCHKLKIAIELDCYHHNTPDQKNYDNERTCKLKEYGIDVIRFWNYEVINEIEIIMRKL